MIILYLPYKLSVFWDFFVEKLWKCVCVCVFVYKINVLFKLSRCKEKPMALNVDLRKYSLIQVYKT